MMLLSHPTGNRNLRAVGDAFHQSNLLSAFVTSIAVFPNSIWEKLGKVTGQEDIMRRSYDPVWRDRTHAYPLREVLRLLVAKTNLNTDERSPFSVEGVYRHIDKKAASLLARSQAKGVYAYEDGALLTFREAKKRGLYTLYDLPIAYWEVVRTLLQEETERLPEWANTMKGGTHYSQEKRDRKVAELELSDAVVVPSKFVQDSLPAWAKDKQVVLSPFGSPARVASPGLSTGTGNRKLRILFAGSMGQRKGLGDLFSAVNMLGNQDVELVVMGSLMESPAFYNRQCPSFIHEPTRPHAKVLELMRSCDVFCLPSIAEGRALVMQEAMSQGLPLIITPNTGGEDLVENSETGFLVPIRSPERIAEKINWFLENRSSIPDMGRAAQIHAASYSWEGYANTIVSHLLHQL